MATKKSAAPTGTVELIAIGEIHLDVGDVVAPKTRFRVDRELAKKLVDSRSAKRAEDEEEEVLHSSVKEDDFI